MFYLKEERIQMRTMMLALALMTFFPARTLAVSEESEVIKGERPVIGWLERVRIFPGELDLKAKIDTGAKSSSINAPNIVTFERDGKRWASFELSDREKKKMVRIEKMIHRTTMIKRKGAEPQERLVIRMFICLGKDYKEIEINLADRRGFNHQVLIGRNDLANVFNVNIDPSVKFVREPLCSPPESLISDIADQTE